VKIGTEDWLSAGTLIAIRARNGSVGCSKVDPVAVLMTLQDSGAYQVGSLGRLWSAAASLCLELRTRYEARLTEIYFRLK